MLSKKRTIEAINLMKELYPNARGELNYDTPFQYLIAVILSAQATDISVNKATPLLFEAYPTAETLAQASLEDVMMRIKTIGLYKTKAKNIIKASQMLVETFNGEVPKTKKRTRKLTRCGKKNSECCSRRFV